MKTTEPFYVCCYRERSDLGFCKGAITATNAASEPETLDAWNKVPDKHKSKLRAIMPDNADDIMCGIMYEMMQGDLGKLRILLETISHD